MSSQPQNNMRMRALSLAREMAPIWLICLSPLVALTVLTLMEKGDKVRRAAHEEQCSVYKQDANRCAEAADSLTSAQHKALCADIIDHYRRSCLSED